MLKRFGSIFIVIGLTLSTACQDSAAPYQSNSASVTPASVSASGAQQITIKVANKVRFDPSSIIVRAGLAIELTLRNEGQIPHDFVLTEGLSAPVKIVAAGGQTATSTFTLDRPGKYTFFCSVPGHQDAGMRGTITAQ